MQDWSGYIGQWDNRLWRGDVPEIVTNWTYDFIGLAPGFTKRDTVAWFCSHRHNPTGNEFYRYSYLFKYRVDLPAGAKTFKLPDNPKIRIFAVTVARNSHDAVSPAQPLYDELADHTPEAPKLAPAGGQFSDTTTVAIVHPLYWREGATRYTLDGSDPVASSPAYVDPLTLHGTTILKAATFDAAGQAGPVATAKFEIVDTTAPKLISATSCPALSAMWLVFSEPLEKSAAENVAHYRLDESTPIASAVLTGNSTTVLLKFATPLASTDAHLTVSELRDASAAGNMLPSTTLAVEAAQPVYRHPALAAGGTAEVQVPGLPVGKSQPWTMNLFVRAGKMPENRTLIAGFGQSDDKGATGTGRYLAVFANGLHLWGHGSDLETNTAFVLNRWQMLTVTYDGQVLRLYADGRLLGTNETELTKDEAIVRLAPIDPWDKERRFQGEIRDFTVWDGVLPAETLRFLQTATDVK